MLISLQRQFSNGMSNLTSQMTALTRDFSDFKCEVFKKKLLRKVTIRG